MPEKSTFDLTYGTGIGSTEHSVFAQSTMLALRTMGRAAAARHMLMHTLPNARLLRTSAALAHKGCSDQGNNTSQSLPQVPPIQSAEPTGFDLVLSRTSNILLNITEVVMSKVS